MGKLNDGISFGRLGLYVFLISFTYSFLIVFMWIVDTRHEVIKPQTAEMESESRFNNISRKEALTPQFISNDVSEDECQMVEEMVELEAHKLQWSKEHLSIEGNREILNPQDSEKIIQVEAVKKTAAIQAQIWSDIYLTDMESLEESIDESFSEKLALAAKKYALQENSKGLCLRGVRIALDTVLSQYMEGSLPTQNLHGLPLDVSWGSTPNKNDSPGSSAESFKKWAKENPMSMCFMLGLADVSSVQSSIRNKGNIYIYGKGRCGFNSEYGHIEVLVNPRSYEVCSDHCRYMDVSCKPDLILSPVKSCDWIVKYQSIQEHSLNYFHGHLNWSAEKPYYLDSWHDEYKEVGKD